MLDLQKWVKLLNPTYSMCKIHCYGGRAQLEAVCRSNPIAAAALRYSNKFNGKNYFFQYYYKLRNKMGKREDFIHSEYVDLVV